MIRCLLIVAVVAGVTPVANADECRKDGVAICFDLGNRLVVSGGTDGLGGEIAVRHLIRTDDPGVTWRFEHRMLAFTLGGHVDAATLYEARYLRHSRDGYLTLPSSPPRRIHLPFDVGVDATVLGVTVREDAARATVRVIRAGAFADFTRSRDFRRRLAVGLTMRWDADVDVGAREAAGHRVVPFSGGTVDAAWESRDGLWRLGARADGGLAWSDEDGWTPFVEAQAGAERVLVAVNDRPLSVYAQASYDDRSGELILAAGLRFAPIARTRSPAQLR